MLWQVPELFHHPHHPHPHHLHHDEHDVKPADTAGGVEEPVHEDSRTVVVWIVSKQTVPLVLLKIL